jgi:broad specificity phosphatase PhoE
LASYGTLLAEVPVITGRSSLIGALGTRRELDRVAGWLASLEPSRTVAVTHPAVVRAAVVRAAILVALDAPPKSFWRINIAPVSRTVLHLREGRWTLRL